MLKHNKTFFVKAFIALVLFAASQTYAENRPTGVSQVQTAAAPASATTETLPQYTVGTGNKYLLTVGQDLSDVTIFFVESTPQKLTVEIYIESKTDNPSLQVKMWQQFQLGLVNGKVSILKGIMKIPQIGKPQILPNEYLQGYDGVQMKSFLISSESQLNGKKVTTENVTANGKTFSSTHYRHGENNQQVDFWISDEAKPLGLVKMSSKGGALGMNYTMEYRGSATGVKSGINPAEAEPLNDMAKAFLPLLGASLFKF